MIDPSEESENVAIYDLNDDEGLGFENCLTIIDTPNYVEEDAEKTMKTTELIRKFFDDPDLIQKVDLIGFVLDSSETDFKFLPLHIYCSLISIFGVRVKDNVDFFLTSAENEDPFMWSDVVDAGLVPYGPFLPGQQNHHKFNDFHSNGFPLDTLESVFSSLKMSTTKSMSARKQALDGKRRLNSILCGLRQRTKINLNKSKEFREIKEKFCRHSSNEEEEFELEVTEGQKDFSPFGEYATNCNDCQIACHTGCREKRCSADCDAMDHSVPEEERSCLVCRCPLKVHGTESYNWTYEQYKKTTTGAFIRAYYEEKLEKNLTAEEVMRAVDADVAEKKKDVLQDAEAILRHANRLNEIEEYLESNYSKEQFFIDSFYVMSVVDDLMDTEQEDKQQDWQEKVVALQNLRQLAEGNVVGVDEDLFWRVLPEGEDEVEEEELVAI